MTAESTAIPPRITTTKTAAGINIRTLPRFDRGRSVTSKVTATLRRETVAERIDDLGVPPGDGEPVPEAADERQGDRGHGVRRFVHDPFASDEARVVVRESQSGRVAP